MSKENEITVDLETVSTRQLVDEICRRSRCFFIVMRPMADDPEHAWSRSWGVDGKNKDMPVDALDRVLGLIQRATFDCLYVPPTLDDIV